MKFRHFIFGILLIATAALLAPGCRKIEPVVPGESESSETPEAQKIPLVFNAIADSTMTKAVTNKAMGSAYDKNESFVVFAAYSDSAPFDPTACSDFWDHSGLVTASYNDYVHAWVPKNASDATLVYYWPRAGYLTFQAYSPANAPGLTSVNHTWSNGFTFNDFSVQSAGSQYDLLYTERVENCQRSNYTVSRNNGYDDDPNYPTFIYNGINLAFEHALSLIEVQTSSSLGANASKKFYVQKIEIKNAYNKGTFTQSTVDPATGTGGWAVNTSTMDDYTVLDKGTDWQLVPGADESPVSVNPAQTLMLLPQTLDRGTVGTLETGTDAYLEVTYKEDASGITRTAQIRLTDPWIRGNKYVYKLVFSNFIEFTATITKWDDQIVGYHRIII